MNDYQTRDRDEYRTGQHRTVIVEHIPSQAGVHFCNRLPQLFKNAPTFKAFKTHLKCVVASLDFNNVDEVFFNFIGQPLYWLADADAEVGKLLAWRERKLECVEYCE